MLAIETNKLTKKFGNKIVVDSLELSIKKGELFSLLGVNGAGKTTTIKMLSTLSKPTSGDAKLLGDSVLAHSQKVKEKINLSPQETAVAPNLSVRENLELIAGIYFNDRQDIKSEVNQIIKDFKLEEITKQKAKTLSGGWQRRLSIAMALISKPEILFLDEPTLGLDVLARRELWSTIKKLKGKITIILTTHYMEEAKALSDRIGIMAKGKIKAVGTVEQILKSQDVNNLEDAFIKIVSAEEGAK